MATSPFLPLPPGLEITALSVESDRLTVSIKACAPTSCCPLCLQPARRVHSHYQRAPADLPCGGQPVRLYLLVRKFFCDTPHCPRRIFTERLPDLLRPWARVTNRLRQGVEVIGFATSGEAGARLASQLAMPLPPTTLLRRVMAYPVVVPAHVPHVGIDDFAFRRGRTYGTILIDLDTHRVVDLLPDRTTDTAKLWFATHPEITLISRDRGKDYAAAAAAGAPQAQQVADRFHLIRNLAEAAELVLARSRAEIRQAHAPVRPADAGDTVGEVPAQPTAPTVWRPHPTPQREQARLARRAQRFDQYQQVCEFHARNVSNDEIARRMGISARTVRRWLAHGSFPEARQRRRKRSHFDAHAPYVLQRWQEGCRNGLQLWRELRDRGYPDSPQMLYQFLRVLRTGGMPPLPATAAVAPPTPTPLAAETTTVVATPLEHFAARNLVWLLVRDGESLDETEQHDLSLLRTGSPTIEHTYQLVQAFVAMARTRQGTQLEAWLDEVRASQIPELVRFASGVDHDKAAVVAGLTAEYSNGVVEGNVNRLKLIKKQMYGRASFELLRQRVLYAA